jgi:hypothetical protein
VSGKAREAIEKAGGTVKLHERKDPAALAKAKRNTAKKARQAGLKGGPAARSPAEAS